MITAYLKGGLGNQMFQIATAYSLSLSNDDVCCFDFTNGLFTQKPANYYKDNIFSKIENNKIQITNKYTEPKFNYSEIPYKSDMIIDGYFQSEKYFINHRKQIIQLFKNESIIDTIYNKYSDILKNSVSVHIRRGDYVNLQKIHPVQDISYYQKSFDFLNPENILIFSDDITWCKNNFKSEKIFFIENQKDYEDIYLMSLCNNNIIANSTFSWWGAWLNENENKKVFAPKKWFGENYCYDFSDIYTKEMILI